MRDSWQNNSANNEQQDWNGNFVSPPRWTTAASEKHVTTTRIRHRWCRLSDSTATQPTYVTISNAINHYHRPSDSTATQPTYVTISNAINHYHWLSDNASTQPTYVNISNATNRAVATFEATEAAASVVFRTVACLSENNITSTIFSERELTMTFAVHVRYLLSSVRLSVVCNVRSCALLMRRLLFNVSQRS